LGENFFRQAPEQAGVYVMRDAAENILYIGKAKNLRQRLQNYRVANPDRMPRRHLRMVRQVARIEFQFCASEIAALKQEAKLLRTLKPRFNRAGVWPATTRFLVWRQLDERLELGVTDVPETGWQRLGPLGGGAHSLRRTLACLLWLAMNPTRAVSELPTGWMRGNFGDSAHIHCGEAAVGVMAALSDFLWEASNEFVPWLEAQFSGRTHLFERAVIDGELEALKDFAARRGQKERNRRQLVLL
jgi:predicted GIY-YIG superfamily endonuclease